MLRSHDLECVLRSKRKRVAAGKHCMRYCVSAPRKPCHGCARPAVQRVPTVCGSWTWLHEMSVMLERSTGQAGHALDPFSSNGQGNSSLV